MKRLMSIIEGMAVISFLAVVTSCQEYLPFDDHDLTVQTYEKDFVSTFGKPAENHQWGFVQQPIIDYSAGQTRACLTNSNQWNKEFGLDVPVPLTADQKNTVTKWFEEHQNPSSITINWADYFVQQVSSSQYGNNMNHMCDGDTHIERFNSGKGSSTNVEMADGTVWYDEIIYMHDQPYNDFSYYESFGSTLMKNHYVLVLGSTIDPQNEHGLAGMFFLGFDYEAQGQNDNQKIARDYFFNDWIVKLTPANSQFNGDNRIVRVLCEDLGNDDADFDYNDIVFDVSFITENNVKKAKITIQAVSGTLPIYVGIHPASANSDLYEAHYLVGENELRPVNRPNATANYTVPLSDMGINTDGNITYASAKDIPIYVVGENGVHEIGNSVIPQKIACSVNAVWPTEGQRIDNCYEHFKDWIVDESANMEWITETANTNNNQNTQAPEEETQTPEEEIQTPEEETQTPVVTPEIDENAVSVFSGSKTMNNWGDAAFTLLDAGKNENVISSAINAGKKKLTVVLSSCATSYDVFLCTTWSQDANLGSTQTVTVDGTTSQFSFSLTDADATTISQAGLMIKVKANNNTEGGKPMIISNVVLDND